MSNWQDLRESDGLEWSQLKAEDWQVIAPITTNVFAEVYSPLFKGKSLEEIARISHVPLSVLKEVEKRAQANFSQSTTSQSAWCRARIYSFLLRGKTFYSADADLAKKLPANFSLTEDTTNWKGLSNADWIELAELIEPIAVKGDVLEDEEFDFIANEVGSSELTERALKDWKSKSPEQFRNILEAQ